MTSLERMQDLLPLPYSIAGDSLVAALLNDWALQLEAFEEDIDRMRKSHWIELSYTDADIDKLAALLNIHRFAGEPSRLFRERFLALVRARLNGAIAPNEIRQFVYEYLQRMENVLQSILVPGLRKTPLETAYGAQAERPKFRPLQFVEWPARLRRSSALADRGGRVTHLFRWSEKNRSLFEASVTFAISGAIGNMTTIPVIVNLTTKTLYGYRGVVPFGRRLLIDAAADGSARAQLDDRNVSDRLFSIHPFERAFDEHAIERVHPVSPSMPLGTSEWLFATLGFYDERGFDHVHFVLDDPDMTEGVFDRTTFDHSLFPAGTIAAVEMSWIERQPASFEVHVPRTIVIEPRTLIEDFQRAGASRPPHEEIAEDLTRTLPDLRGAGIRAELLLEPLRETQEQVVRFLPSWVVIPTESGSAGERDQLSIGARFGDAPLDRSRLN